MILAVANQKGGVGKTTTAVNLASALSAAGDRVTLIDLDPQGNASTGLGVGYENRRPGTYEVLIGAASAHDAQRATSVPKLTVIPSHPDLAGGELELVVSPDREKRLLLSIAELRAGPDYVIIDCPPSLGLLTLNALVAADGVLVPLQCEFFALEGLAQVTRTVERVRQRHNPSLLLEGILLTMFDRRSNLSQLVAADARATFGPLVFDTVIPRNVRISEAPSHGKPVFLYDAKSAGAQAYTALAAELLRRQRGRRA